MSQAPDLKDFERRLNRPIRLKLSEFEANHRLTHVLFADQFDRDLLEHLGRVALRIRALSANRETTRFLTDLLPHKRVMLYFTQTSTRTFLSFLAACHLLGLRTAEIRDPAVSSEFKGESPLDSMRMFSSYSDLVVVRSKIPSFAESCAYLMNDLEQFHQRNVPIVNGGSGADEHPTQALLDFFTLQRAFQFTSRRDSSRWSRFDDLRRTYADLTRGLAGKSYAFCGDIGRGRTVRSLASLLAQFDGMTMHFVAPDHPKLSLQPSLRNQLLDAGVRVHEHHTLADVIEDVDALYMTRVQHEHDTGDETGTIPDIAACKLTVALVERMKAYAPILHPFPRNDEIPSEIDYDPRAGYFRQARNGMWIRAALLAYLFDVDTRITSYYDTSFADFHDYNEAVFQ